MQTELRDGTRVLIRPIRPADKGELEAGLHRLSPASVQKRFLAPKTHFSKAELRYLTEVDGHDHVAFVAVRPERPETIVAVARYVALGDPDDTAEAAIVVGDPLQGLGLGTALADELARAAIRNGVRRFSATMLSENRAAHRLMTRLSAPLEFSRGGAGQDELVVELAA